MTKEEIEKQIGIPVMTLAGICECRKPEKLVTVLSMAITTGKLIGNKDAHEGINRLLTGKVVISQQPLNVVGYVDL